MSGTSGWNAKSWTPKLLAVGWMRFGYELPADEGEAWAKFTNDVLMESASKDDALFPLCTVPLQDGDRAAACLKQP